MAGAPSGNNNAQKHGLYKKTPDAVVVVAADVSSVEMAVLARDLGGAALWIADELAARIANIEHKDQKLVSLYASVGQELHQVAAELEGESGIKPAPLGKLSDAGYEELMRESARALSLILSQCAAAYQHVFDAETALGYGLFRMGGVNPVLHSLAGSMRSAKRIMREMAANQSWRVNGADDKDDLTARLMRMLNG